MTITTTSFIYVDVTCAYGSIKTVLIVANPGLRLFLMGNLQWRCSDSISIWDYWTLSITGLYLTVDNLPLVYWLAIKKNSVEIWYVRRKHMPVCTHTHALVYLLYCNLVGCSLVWIWDVFFASSSSSFFSAFWKGTGGLGRPCRSKTNPAPQAGKARNFFEHLRQREQEHWVSSRCCFSQW